jgi:GntR family transcriptional regulator
VPGWGRFRRCSGGVEHGGGHHAGRFLYGIHGIFEDQGHVMTRIREEVSARMPRPEERRDLRLPPGVPVLDVLHTSLDQDGQPYELTRFVMRADLTGLLYDVPVE